MIGQIAMAYTEMHPMTLPSEINEDLSLKAKTLARIYIPPIPFSQRVLKWSDGKMVQTITMQMGF